jgi:dGTPase
MTYDAHDTDDALKLRLVTLDEMQEVPLVRAVVAEVRARYSQLTPQLLRKTVVHRLIDLQVSDTLERCQAELQVRGFGSPAEAMASDFLIGPGAELAGQKRELERFLYERVYRHPRLVAIRTAAQDRLRRMYEGYCARPDLIPAHYQDRLRKVGPRRMAVEYIAGMTDRFCEETFAAHFAD